MLLDVGILLGIYIGVRLLESKQLKNKKQVKPAPIYPVKSVFKEKLTIQTVKKHQALLEETTSDNPEKKHDHYLKISTISMGIVTIGNIFPPLHLLSLGIIAYTSMPILRQFEKEAFNERKVGHHMLLLVLIVLALSTGQFLALSMAILFYHLGKKNLAKIQDKSSKRLFTHLFEQQSQKVWVLKDQVEMEMPLEAIHIDDIVVVNTGEAIPIDGIITEGVAMVDQHALTGESQPTEKGVGDKVFAYTSAISGRICIKVEKTGKDTTISKIGDILNQTVDFKSTAQLKAEKWSDKIAKPMLGIGFFALPILGPVNASAVLNTSFGDRLRVVAPTGMMNHLSLAFHQGILVKDGRALESLSQVDTVLFDKTGTLTEEEPKVGKVILCSSDYKENDLLMYTAAAEGKLTHPIAKALFNRAKELNINLPNIEDSQYQIGLGITVSMEDKTIKVGSHRFMTMADIKIPETIEKAMLDSHGNGHSLIIVAINNEIKGAIEIQPSVRLEVKQIIAGLRQRGIKYIAIVSGDHKQPTQKLAKDLGMDNYFYDVLPENKAQIVEQLQTEGKIVCFVGDGINDVIAIKKANVSISLKGATSIATDLAQVILMDGNLSRLCDLFDLATSLEKNFRNSLLILTIPSAFNMLGGAFLNFNLLTSIIINNTALLVALIAAKK